MSSIVVSDGAMAPTKIVVPRTAVAITMRRPSVRRSDATMNAPARAPAPWTVKSRLTVFASPSNVTFAMRGRTTVKLKANVPAIVIRRRFDRIIGCDHAYAMPSRT